MINKVNMINKISREIRDAWNVSNTLLNIPWVQEEIVIKKFILNLVKIETMTYQKLWNI